MYFNSLLHALTIISYEKQKVRFNILYREEVVSGRGELMKKKKDDNEEERGNDLKMMCLKVILMKIKVIKMNASIKEEGE